MSTWAQRLAQNRLRLEERLGRPPWVAILGVGQELGGDDAAGVEAAGRLLALNPGNFYGPEMLRGPDAGPLPPGSVLVIQAGPAPENFTGTLRRFQPDLALLVDAAQMDLPPGEIRWLEPQETGGFGASTHTFPLGVLAGFLEQDLGCAAAILGIQPQGNAFGAPLSPPVARAVEDLCAALIRELAPASH